MMTLKLFGERGTNLQFDSYRNTKEVLKAFCSEQEERLTAHLVSQGSFFSTVITQAMLKLNSVWSIAQKNLPKIISNFTIRYVHNTLPTKKNLLHFIANSMKSVPDSVLYADLPGFVTPSVVTGDTLRPDLLLAISNKCLYILELTVGFENNLLSNFSRKKNK